MFLRHGLTFQLLSTVSKDTINGLIKLFHLVLHSTLPMTKEFYFTLKKELMDLSMGFAGLTVFHHPEADSCKKKCRTDSGRLTAPGEKQHPASLHYCPKKVGGALTY